MRPREGIAVRWGVVGTAFGDLVSTRVLTTGLLVLCRVRVPEVRWEVVPAAGLPVEAGASAGMVVSSLSTRLSVGVMKLASEACALVVGYLAIIGVLGGSGRLTELTGMVRDVARRPWLVVAGSGHAGDAD